MGDKMPKSLDDSQSRRSSSPRPSTSSSPRPSTSSSPRPSTSSSPRPSSSSSPQLVVTPKFSEASLAFLDNLDIGEMIGHGSFGNVYIALHTPDKKPYAIKKVQLDHLDPTQYDLVQAEVANMNMVSHPGLLKLMNSLTWTTYIVVVMPLCAYTSCDQIMRRAYPTGLPESALCLIFKDVINAVTYLHSKNIIHRTIKGSHILIGESGAAVLTGFRHLLTLPPNQERMTVHNVMTEMSPYINWMSPEMLLQVKDSRGFGLNSDMYSIGITILELGNGVVPYSDVSPSGILARKLEEPPPKLWDKHCLPSQEASGVTPPYFPDVSAPRSILRTSPDHAYQDKQYSQNIRKFVSLCTVSAPETRISSEQATKFKFYTLVAKENSSATLRSLSALGPPLQFRSKLEAAGPSSQAAHSSKDAVEWDIP